MKNTVKLFSFKLGLVKFSSVTLQPACHSVNGGVYLCRDYALRAKRWGTYHGQAASIVVKTATGFDRALPLNANSNSALSLQQTARAIGYSTYAGVCLFVLNDSRILLDLSLAGAFFSRCMRWRARRARQALVLGTVASTPQESLMAAKKLADHLGGVDAAKTAVDALAKLS